MKHNDIVDVRSDKSPVYQATVADKKLLLLKCFDLYEAGKKENQQRYFDLRTAILEIVYSIQEDTITQDRLALKEEMLSAIDGNNIDLSVHNFESKEDVLDWDIPREIYDYAYDDGFNAGLTKAQEIIRDKIE